MTTTAGIEIVEGHNLLRRGLERVLSGNPAFEVVASVENPDQLLAAEETAPADVIVYGPAAQGAENFGVQVARLSAHGKVLVVSEFSRPHRLTCAVRAGAYGCVCIQSDDGELLRAVETVADGGFHVSPALAPRLHAELREPADPVLLALAPRECETLRWLAAGLTHRQIGRNMGLTEATVSTYVKRIRTKLNAGNKAELTRMAIELGLLEPVV